jgi:NADH-quinone oxidoreductase subunit J
MSVDLILFIILAVVAIATAAGLLLSRNAVYAALFLVLNFATVAVFYLILNAPFIALTQITVYAGAIMVLFLFVIMLLGGEKLPKTGVLPWQRPLAIGLAAILVAETVYLLFFRSGDTALVQRAVESFGNPQAIGDILFNKYLLPFEVTSILLLVAMVGAIVMTKKEKGGQE